MAWNFYVYNVLDQYIKLFQYPSEQSLNLLILQFGIYKIVLKLRQKGKYDGTKEKIWKEQDKTKQKTQQKRGKKLLGYRQKLFLLALMILHTAGLVVRGGNNLKKTQKSQNQGMFMSHRA